MEKEKFREIVSKLGYERDKWLTFQEIDSIVLKSGRGFYPSWKFLKFLITKEDRILVKHGLSEPYGARLSGLSMVSADATMLYFKPSATGMFQIEPSPVYGDFRQPRVGDAVRATEGLSVSHGESMVMEVKMSFNASILILSHTLNVPKGSRLSFYDTSVYSDRENCVHSTMSEGIYMHFVPNQSKRKFQGSFFHEEIKFRDIKEINLSVGREYYNKTYKLD
jgi:hypothetical protein